MSTQYECLKSPDLYAEAFGIAPPDALLGKEVWPRQPGFFIRKALVAAEQAQVSTPESPAENQSDAAPTPAPASPQALCQMDQFWETLHTHKWINFGRPYIYQRKKPPGLFLLTGLSPSRQLLFQKALSTRCFRTR